jgi:hypothetical protein
MNRDGGFGSAYQREADAASELVAALLAPLAGGSTPEGTLSTLAETWDPQVESGAERILVAGEPYLASLIFRVSRGSTNGSSCSG